MLPNQGECVNPTESKAVLSKFQQIFESLKTESDRGCVLVVGSMVERSLENQITMRLLPKLKKEDDLMGRSANCPISGFSAKINLAYRLGIIPENERTIFHQLRDLRNICAHHIDQQNFSAGHFKDRVKNIINNSLVMWDAILVNIAAQQFPDDPPKTVDMFVERIGWRIAFELFFSLVIAHKDECINRVSQVNRLYETTGHA